MTDTTAGEGVMTESEVRDWIDACNHEPARNVLRRYLALTAQPDIREDEAEEGYKIGKDEGYEDAVRDIDLATGGDGEYYFSTIDGGCPDACAMKARIVERFNAAQPSAGAQGEAETLRVLLDNLVVSQSLSKALREKATDDARSYLYGLRHRATPAQPDTGAVEALREGDLWWNPEDPENGYNSMEDAFGDATQWDYDGPVKLDRAALMPSVWALKIDIDTTGDGEADDYEIRLFATEAEADAFKADAALSKPNAQGREG